MLNDVALQKMSGTDLLAQAAYHLKKECYREYNPYFMHLTAHEHEKAAENVENQVRWNIRWSIRWNI